MVQVELQENMVQVEFQEKEAGLMKEILESYLSDLAFQIGRTDSHSWREDLKRKKTVVMDMISKIEHEAA